MFGFTRKRATKAAIDSLRPLVGSLQHSAGLPPHFWANAYVLGFFQFLVGHHAKLATSGKIAGADLGQTLSDVFTALSNMNGAALAKQSTELAFAQDAEFNRGADDAAAIAFYQMGILKNEASHPLVLGAQRLANSPADRDQIMGMMFMTTIYRELSNERRSGLR